MARKTIKELENIIYDLELELKVYKAMVHDLNKQIDVDTTFNDYSEIIIKKLDQAMILAAKKNELIDNLIKENTWLKEEVDKLKTNNVQKIKNERGAGRKTKINDDIIKRVTILKLKGKSIRAIAKEVELSVGTIHKIITEQG